MNPSTPYPAPCRLSAREYRLEMRLHMELTGLSAILERLGDGREGLSPAIAAAGALETALAIYRHHSELHVQHSEAIYDGVAAAAWLTACRHWLLKLEFLSAGKEDQLHRLAIPDGAWYRRNYPGIAWGGEE